MVDLFPTPTTALLESTTRVTDGIARVTDSVPLFGNVAILTDSTCTAGRAAINFYYSPNPVSKVCFGASCLFGLVGAVSSGGAVVSSYLGIPAASLIGAFGSRTFNRLGKYTLHMGNITNCNITNVTEIAKLMS